MFSSGIFTLTLLNVDTERVPLSLGSRKNVTIEDSNLYDVSVPFEQIPVLILREMFCLSCRAFMSNHMKISVVKLAEYRL